MKKTEDIENLNFESLELIASDNTIPAPDTLGKRIEDAILFEEIASKKQGRASLRKVLYGCCAALATAAAAISVAYFVDSSQPADTFSDPHQAYEEIQKTFDYISSEMGRGSDLLKSVL